MTDEKVGKYMTYAEVRRIVTDICEKRLVAIERDRKRDKTVTVSCSTAYQRELDQVKMYHNSILRDLADFCERKTKERTG